MCCFYVPLALANTDRIVRLFVLSRRVQVLIFTILKDFNITLQIGLSG